ncbi:hypothetical protein CWI75_13265 [Kineobactrum sediminis]|uniref:HD-GYP domain-containing protein n=1 Tax=Kineobactrum sediminis TaxID=1905677 RepID=A0A2N5Y0Y1_9GAMM|nr:HD domain-containing phosphohydrolase [Kineobactrum sediminis]PLW82046.1 hypothetical protein CWI75_13265 [Kineobactrum sediminis]
MNRPEASVETYVDSPDYLKHVTALGDSRAVTATEDIYSRSAVKVVASGYRVNSLLLDKLLRHKLLKPIEQSCLIEAAVDKTTLIERANELLEEMPALKELLIRYRGEEFVLACFGRMILPTAIRNKLTVLASQSPQLMDHSLWCVMACVFLGQEIELGEGELRNLAIAALLHDIGQLHTDHRILDPREKLDPALRRQLQSHPLIGSSIISNLPDYDSSVAQAIGEHHERMDGSGYPHGLLGSEISRCGRILSFVEMSLGIVRSAGPAHLANVIKTYAHQFDRTITRAFWKHLDLDYLGNDYPFDTSEIPDMLKSLSEALDGWHTVSDTVSAPVWRLIDRDVSAINHAMIKAGVDQTLVEELAASSDRDTLAHREVCSILREGLRQIRESVDWLKNAAPVDTVMQRDEAALAWLEQVGKVLFPGSPN